MTRKLITMFGIAAMTAGLAFAAAPAKTSRPTAQPTRKEGVQMQADKQKLAHDLGLTDAQKRQLQEIQTKRSQLDKEFRLQLQTKHNEFLALQKARDPRAEEVSNDIQAMRLQWQDQRKKLTDQIRDVLTPEQQKKLDAARTPQATGRG